MEAFKLMTPELEKKFPALYAQDGKGYDAEVIAKYFFPAGRYTFYATEYDPEQRLFFGLTVNMESELGYVSLDELASLRVGPFRLRIERDLYFKGGKLRDVLASEGRRTGVPKE